MKKRKRGIEHTPKERPVPLVSQPALVPPLGSVQVVSHTSILPTFGRAIMPEGFLTVTGDIWGHHT